MIQRCTDEHASNYHNYGGRGITVDPRWLESVENFFEDMGNPPSPHHTLDRRDNDKGYCKENCRWVTSQVQGNNKRTNRRIETPWGKLTVSEASQKSGIGETTLLYRLSRGATFRDSLFSKPDTTSALHERV